MNNHINVKLQGNYFLAIVETLKEFNEEDINWISDIHKQVYREFKETIIRTALRASVNFYPKKMVSVKLLKSQCLLCYLNFNGAEPNPKYGFGIVAMNELCRQIEEQMIKKENLHYKI